MQDRGGTIAIAARWFALACCLAGISGFACLSSVTVVPTLAAKDKPAAATPNPMIGQGRAGLPVAVNEMRDAILAAARSGDLDELQIPIQWNELPPHFGDLSVKDTLALWKKNSPDGSGREWLARLIDLLEAPYAVVHRGADIENNRVFLWPAFSEIPLTNLSPALHVELLRLVPAREAARMIAQGHYDGYGLAIGADGTWHAFDKVVRKKPGAK